MLAVPVPETRFGKLCVRSTAFVSAHSSSPDPSHWPPPHWIAYKRLEGNYQCRCRHPRHTDTQRAPTPTPSATFSSTHGQYCHAPHANEPTNTPTSFDPQTGHVGRFKLAFTRAPNTAKINKLFSVSLTPTLQSATSPSFRQTRQTHHTQFLFLPYPKHHPQHNE